MLGTRRISIRRAPVARSSGGVAVGLHRPASGGGKVVCVEASRIPSSGAPTLTGASRRFRRVHFGAEGIAGCSTGSGRRSPVRRRCARRAVCWRMMSFRTGQPSYEPADAVRLDDAVPARASCADRSDPGPGLTGGTRLPRSTVALRRELLVVHSDVGRPRRGPQPADTTMYAGDHDPGTCP